MSKKDTAVTCDVLDRLFEGYPDFAQIEAQFLDLQAAFERALDARAAAAAPPITTNKKGNAPCQAA
jgi:hypothetical protein